MSENFITPTRLEAKGELQRRIHALDAATKRLQAINAQSKADRLKREAKEAAATAHAKAAVSALSPEPQPVTLGNGRQEPFPACPSHLEGKERKAFYASLEVFSAETAKYASDSFLQTNATSEFSPAADRTVAMAELNRRGWQHHPESGCWSKRGI